MIGIIISVYIISKNGVDKMNWRERMDVHVDRDAIDEKALEKFNEWVSMAEGDCPREECIAKGYDPEILNEFCFYPLKYWGRLIDWANEEAEDEFEPSYPQHYSNGYLHVP